MNIPPKAVGNQVAARMRAPRPHSGFPAARRRLAVAGGLTVVALALASGAGLWWRSARPPRDSGGGAGLPAPLPAGHGNKLRFAAEQALRAQFPDLDLSAYDPGYLVRLESPTPEAGARVVVSWLGREPLALEKGATPDLDRKQVLKIEVWLTGAGEVLKITDRRVWLNRNAQPTPAH